MDPSSSRHLVTLHNHRNSSKQRSHAFTPPSPFDCFLHPTHRCCRRRQPQFVMRLLSPYHLADGSASSFVRGFSIALRTLPTTTPALQPALSFPFRPPTQILFCYLARIEPSLSVVGFIHLPSHVFITPCGAPTFLAFVYSICTLMINAL